MEQPFETYRAIWKLSMPSTYKHVLQNLAWHYNYKHDVDPLVSQETIAAECGMSLSTVKRSIKWLKENNYLVAKKRYNNSNVYTLNFELIETGQSDPVSVNMTPDETEAQSDPDDQSVNMTPQSGQYDTSEVSEWPTNYVSNYVPNYDYIDEFEKSVSEPTAHPNQSMNNEGVEVRAAAPLIKPVYSSDLTNSTDLSTLDTTNSLDPTNSATPISFDGSMTDADKSLSSTKADARDYDVVMSQIAKQRRQQRRQRVSA